MNLIYICIILAFTNSAQGEAPGLCQNLFFKTAYTADPAVSEKVNKLKRIAREVRKQSKWYLSFDQIQISTILLNESIQYTIESLVELKKRLPEKAQYKEIEDYDYRFLGLSAKKVKTKVPTTVDQIFVDQIIENWKLILKSEKVNYVNYLNLIYLSVWASSPASIARNSAWLAGVKKFAVVRDGQVIWNLESHILIDQLNQYIKKDPYTVPVVVKEFFDVDAFIDLWISGVRPLGLNFEERINFDGITGSPLDFLQHDEAHFAVSQLRFMRDINKNGRQKERYLFLKLLNQVRKDKLNPKQIFVIKYFLFYELHELATTLTGQTLHAEHRLKALETPHKRENELRADGITHAEYETAAKYIYGFLIQENMK